VDKNWPLVDRVAFAALIVLIALAIYAYAVMPATIPTSFGYNGTPQAYGPKSQLFLQPGIAAFLWIVFAVVLKNPGRLILPFKVPPERLKSVMAMSDATTRLIRAEIVVALIVFEGMMIQSARLGSAVLGFSAAPVALLGAVLGTAAVFMLGAWRIARG